MISVEAEFDVPAGIAHVYESICDVGEIGYVIAGVQHVEVLNDDESIWKVLVKAGIIAQTLTLRGTILERRPPHGLAFKAEGRNVELTGSIAFEAKTPHITQCRVAVQSEVTGRLASLVNLVARTTQKQLIDQTIANFRTKLTGEPAKAPERADAANRSG